MMKQAKALWMGANVVVFDWTPGKRRELGDKVLKAFKAGSRNMPENMARWAAKNNVNIVNLYRNKRTGTLKVWL